MSSYLLRSLCTLHGYSSSGHSPLGLDWERQQFFSTAGVSFPVHMDSLSTRETPAAPIKLGVPRGSYIPDIWAHAPPGPCYFLRFTRAAKAGLQGMGVDGTQSRDLL